MLHSKIQIFSGLARARAGLSETELLKVLGHPFVIRNPRLRATLNMNTQQKWKSATCKLHRQMAKYADISARVVLEKQKKIRLTCCWFLHAVLRPQIIRTAAV